MKTAQILVMSLMVSGCIEGMDKIQDIQKDMQQYLFIREKGWERIAYHIDKVIGSLVSGKYNQEPCVNNQWLAYVSRDVIPFFLQEKGRVPHAYKHMVEPIVVKEKICGKCSERAEYWKSLDWRGSTVIVGLALLAYTKKDALKKVYAQVKEYVQKLQAPKTSEKKECDEKNEN